MREITSGRPWYDRERAPGWYLGPRSAWDQVVIGPYASREDALADLEDQHKDNAENIVFQVKPGEEEVQR